MKNTNTFHFSKALTRYITTVIIVFSLSVFFSNTAHAQQCGTDTPCGDFSFTTCSCDDLCWEFGDCCTNVCTACASTGPNYDANCTSGGSGPCNGTLNYPVGSGSFQSITAPTADNAVYNIVTDQFSGDYVTFYLEGPNTFEFTSSINGYITITSAANFNDVFAEGFSPVSITITSFLQSGWYTVHFHDDDNCGTAQQFYTTTIQCTSCPAAAPPLANDDCADAMNLTVHGPSCTSPVTINHASSTNSSFNACYNPADPAFDSWYTFTATEQVHTINFTPDGNMAGVIEFFGTQTCGGISSSICIDGSAGEDILWSIYNLTPGEEYVFRVYDNLANTIGTNVEFDICITSPQHLWTGTVSTDWFDANNWLVGTVPTSSNDVFIPDVNLPGGSGNAPFVGPNPALIAFADDLILMDGASITGDNSIGTSLEVHGDIVVVQNAAGFEFGEGTLRIAGNRLQEFLGEGEIGRLSVEKQLPCSGTFCDIFGNLGDLTVTQETSLQSGIFYPNGPSDDGVLTMRSTQDRTAVWNDFGAGFSAQVEPFDDYEVRFERYFTGSGQGYRQVSVPITEQNVESIEGFNVSGVSNAQYEIVSFLDAEANVSHNGWTSLLANVFIWNEAAASTSNLRYWESYINGAMDIARGYSMFGSGGSTLTFSGVPNTGDIDVNITNTQIDANPLHNGWNFVGNPYPSPINWDLVSTDFAAHVFDNSQNPNAFRGVYSSHINGVSSNPSGFDGRIAAGQGFFVEADQAGTIQFANAARISDAEVPFYKEAEMKRSLIRMYLKSDLIKDYTVTYFDADATFGHDSGLEARKYYNSDTDVPNLFVIGDVYHYSIRALPELTTDIVIPLGVNVKKSGMFTFGLQDLNYIPETSIVYFKDSEQGVKIDLRQMPEYEVNLSKGDYFERFYLIVTSPLEITKSAVDCNATYGNLSIHHESNEQWSYQIIDETGNLIATYNLDAPAEVDLPGGEYTLMLTHTSGYVVTETITIDKKPSVEANFLLSSDKVMIGDHVSFENVSSGSDTYVWDFGDGHTSTDLHPVHTYAESGWYEVILYAENDHCNAVMTQSLRVKAPLALNVEEVYSDYIQIYGYGDNVFIQNESFENPISRVSIVNVLGQEIALLENSDVQDQHIQIQVEAGAGKVVFVKVETEEEIVIQRVFLMSY